MAYPVLIFPFIRVEAMAIFPFIILKNDRDRSNEILIRHESIHLKQELELLIVFFYPVYLVLYIINLIRFRSHDSAYRNIAFEREAYLNENNKDYLNKMTFWSWIKYLN